MAVESTVYNEHKIKKMLSIYVLVFLTGRFISSVIVTPGYCPIEKNLFESDFCSVKGKTLVIIPSSAR